MTIVDIRNQIISHFFTNDTFSLKFDISKIQVGENQEPCKETLIYQVFAGLQSQDAVTIIQDVNDTIFVLNDSFANSTQTLTISGVTANAVGEAINQYRDAVGIEDNACNKLSITEKDILNLCIICGDLLEADFQELMDQEEGDEDDEDEGSI